MEHNHDQDRTVFGSCPACDNWQVDIPSHDPDLGVIAAEAINEHLAADHPGVDVVDVANVIGLTSVHEHD